MKERIFTLAKGVEVAEKFDGLTIPYTVPTTVAEMQQVCGGDEAVMVQIFNESYALRVQKYIKLGAARDVTDASADSIRARANTYKPGAPRAERKPGTDKQAGARKQATDTVTAAAASVTRADIEQLRAIGAPAATIAAMEAMLNAAEALENAKREAAAAREAKKNAPTDTPAAEVAPAADAPAPEVSQKRNTRK